jgi:hypothetical protein
MWQLKHKWEFIGTPTRVGNIPNQSTMTDLGREIIILKI